MAKKRKGAKNKHSPLTAVVAKIDQTVEANWPSEITLELAVSFINTVGEAISAGIRSCGNHEITIPAHAVLFELSVDALERKAAADWWQENPKHVNKAKYVYDRHPGLKRLHRLKTAIDQGEADFTSFAKAEKLQNGGTALSSELEALLKVVVAQPTIHGSFPSNFSRWVKKNQNEKNLIFLAFPPKCGGTFLREVLNQLVRGDLHRPVHAYGGREAVPHLPKLATLFLSKEGTKNSIMHAHMPGHYSNLQILNLFDVRPVVMKRNIADMLRSYADMFDTEGREPDGSFNRSLFCGVHADESFLALSSDQQRDFLVYHLAPWYFQFYASWLHAEREGLCPIHWIDYDTLRQRPVELVRSVGQYYGFDFSESMVSNAWAEIDQYRDTLRFNKGISGRGQDFFEPQHHEHFRVLAAGYPEIDFESLGLLSPLVYEDTGSG